MKKSLAHLAELKQDEPQEHHLDILGDLADDYCPELKGIIPRETDEEKELFELLDYAYIGARYHDDYKITPQELKYLARCVELLRDQTQLSCEKKMESFV